MAAEMTEQHDLNALRLLRAAYESGIQNIWFNSGSDLVPFQEAIRRSTEAGEPVPTLRQSVHEHVALSAAMGECMATGGPSMIMAHADLGLLNCGGAIHNASSGGYPIVILSGHPPTTPSERTSKVYWLQEVPDQGAIVRQYMKWDFKMAPYDDPALIISRAVQIAMTPPRGPVYISAPLEVTSGMSDASARLPTADSLGIPTLGAGNASMLEAIVEHLLRAEAPLILTDRLGNDSAAVGVLAELASEFGIGVRASRHRMSFPDDHVSAQGFTVAEADAILVVDAPVPWIPARERPSASAFVAVAAADPVYRRIPLVEFGADMRLACDAGLMLRALLDGMRSVADDSARARASERNEILRKKAEAARRERDRTAAESLADPVPSARSLQAALDSVLLPADILCWEIVPTDQISRVAPATLFEKGGSSLGWSPAAALGYKVMNRENTIVALCGDGGYFFSDPMACLWMQLEHKAPVMTVIANNRGYRTGTSAFVGRYPHGQVSDADLAGGRIPSAIDLASMTRGNGGFGATVQNTKDMVAVLEDARAATNDGYPAVVDVWLPENVTGYHPLK